MSTALSQHIARGITGHSYGRSGSGSSSACNIAVPLLQFVAFAHSITHVPPAAVYAHRCGIVTGLVPVHDPSAMYRLRTKSLTSLLAPAEEFRSVVT